MKPLLVCWWNRLAVALTRDGAVAADIEPDPVAVADFVGSVALRNQPVILVYETSAVDHFFTVCPKGRRKTLRAALAAQFPALGNPATVWTAQAIWSNAAGSSTVLHIDRSNHVQLVRDALAGRGIRLLNAIHLPALIDAGRFAPPHTPLVMLIHTEHDALLYRTDSAGQRQLTAYHQTSRQHIHEDLFTALSGFPAVHVPRLRPSSRPPSRRTPFAPATAFRAPLSCVPSGGTPSPLAPVGDAGVAVPPKGNPPRRRLSRRGLPRPPAKGHTTAAHAPHTPPGLRSLQSLRLQPGLIAGPAASRPPRLEREHPRHQHDTPRNRQSAALVGARFFNLSACVVRQLTHSRTCSLTALL